MYNTFLVALALSPLASLGLAGTHHHVESVRYAGESIDWKPCNKTFECSTIQVPIDHFNTKLSDDNKTFSIPLVRLRGKTATQNLLVNPGGPGGSGVSFLISSGEMMRNITGEGYHLVSFDPRGVGASRPQASCGEALKTLAPRRSLGSLQNGKVVGGFVANSTKLFAKAHKDAEMCAKEMGEHGQYINTPQTAADMPNRNSILDAVGQKDMAYWGLSYGSLLGQTYATMFPERSRRIIIDGIADQFAWYEQRVTGEELAHTEIVLDGFFDECMKAKKCPLSSIADSKEELLSKFLSLVDELAEHPIVNDKQQEFNGADLLFKMFNALYSPNLWSGTAELLKDLFAGNATFALKDKYSGGSEDTAPHYTVRFNDGLSGPRYWPQDRESGMNIILPFFNDTLFLNTPENYFLKQLWKIPRTHSYVPKRDVKTAHPLLILTTEYDPITPSARTAKSAFQGSRIVEVEAYGHCSLSASSVCAKNHIRQFLYNGTLPPTYTRCTSEQSYFVMPKKNKGSKDKSIILPVFY